MEFRTDGIFEALHAPLALVDDPEKRQAFERYVEAARPSLERAMFDALSTVVQAIDEQVQQHYRVSLRYGPGALQLDVQPVAAAPPPEPSATEWSFGDGDTEKVTIRIPSELKDLATRAAGDAGLSANSWFIRSLARSLRMAGEEMERHGDTVRVRRFSPDSPMPPWAEHGRHGRERRERDRDERERGPQGPGRSMKGWIGE